MAGITSREPQKLPQRTTPTRCSFIGSEMGQRVVITSAVARGQGQPYARAKREVHFTGGSFDAVTAVELRALSRHLASQADWLEGTT
jgi:hypothetical protein